MWTRVNQHRVPAFAVLLIADFGLLITLPVLVGEVNNFTYAFAAVVSVAGIGVYIAYVLPVYLRWRNAATFTPVPWTLGRHYRWVNPAACVWVAICVVIFILPQAPAGVPGREEFDWKYVNYAPLMVGAVFLIVGLWWVARARHTFNGPVRNIEFDAGAGVTEAAPPARAGG